MRVLVAIDLSEAADVALREGVSIAHSSADVLAVVRALPILVRESLFFPARDEMLATRAAQFVERETAATRDRVRRLAPIGTEVFIDEGIDYAAIVRRAESWRADLVVVGSHSHSGLRRVLGDVATKVARHAHCSVLVARQTTEHGRVVVATDLSDPSLTAISAAAAEAQRRRATIDVVHASSFTDLELAYLMQITPSRSTSAIERDTEPATVREALSKVGVAARWIPLDGPPAASIVRHAESSRAELVVVGTHGATGLARVALGSVAEKVARACTCSVLVVRTFR